MGSHLKWPNKFTPIGGKTRLIIGLPAIRCSPNTPTIGLRLLKAR
jgi:hypothetical protein